MKKIDLSKLTKEIHFPVTQAIYTPTPKRSWWRKLVNFVTYRRKFKFRQDYILWCPFLSQYIFIPNYFIFDGASVPKVLNGLFNPTGMLLLGAGPHDLGYRYKGLILVNQATSELFFQVFTKSQLDKIFKSLCIHESKMKAASSAATFVLRSFGYLGWRENRKKNSNLFKDFPELYIKE